MNSSSSSNISCTDRMHPNVDHESRSTRSTCWEYFTSLRYILRLYLGRENPVLLELCRALCRSCSFLFYIRDSRVLPYLNILYLDIFSIR